MRKIICFLGLMFLFGCLFLPLVSASYVCPAQYVGITGSGLAMVSIHPSEDGYSSSVGSTFTANATCYLYNVTFKMAKTGLPLGNLQAQLYYVSGAMGSSAVPVGSVIETSQPINASTLTTSQASYVFNFSGSTQLAVGVEYAVVFTHVEGARSLTDYPMAFRGASGDPAINWVAYYDDAWHTSASYDVYFVINGDTVNGGGSPYGTPTLTPVPSGDGDATLEYWGDIVATWIFPILLVLVPAVIAAYYLGKIGFIIGLNIGMILGYAALPSIFGLWTVVMLVLVDIGYFFFARG